jgi:hypothetical protein
MALDTSIIRQATFQPVQFQMPSQANMLANAAQAVSGLQTLESNRMRMRQAQQEEAATSQMMQGIKRAYAMGETPESIQAYEEALIGSGQPQYVNAGMKLRMARMEDAKQQQAQAQMRQEYAQRYPTSAGNALAQPPEAAPQNLLAQAPADPYAGQRQQYMTDLASPNPLIAKAAERGLAQLPRMEMPKAPKPEQPTASQQDYLFAKSQGYKGSFEDFRKLGATNVSVSLPAQEKAFETGLGSAQAKKVIEDKAIAEDAKSIISTVQEGRRLLSSGVITGFGADYLTSFGAALNQVGINFAEDKVANTQAFTANMAANVGRIIKQFGAGTGLSNADREYAEKMAGGKVTLDRKAIERILDINERAARNVIALHNKNVSNVKTNIPLTVEMPETPAAPAATPAAASSRQQRLQQIIPLTPAQR